jgi:predicted dehydrogenase
MTDLSTSTPTADVSSSSRRAFLQQSSAAIVAGSLATELTIARSAHAQGSDLLRLGLIGCGGRGTGAAKQALTADRYTRLVAVADAFEDRLQAGLESLEQDSEIGKRVLVDRDHRFTGFDGYRQVIDSGVDIVLLATPPHFRPMHLRAAIEAGKHVFAEKPVAVDAPGVQSVLETTELARKKNVSIVSGLNTRYSPNMQELMRRIHEGAIGEIVSLHAVRYGDGVWVRQRRPGMTEMEYQMLNWYYFTWLSGDFNVEMFVHQYDMLAWAMRDEPPVRCHGTGGRQARTGPEYGHIYDHFSNVFEYAGGQRACAITRLQPGCSNEISVAVLGTKGTATLPRSGPRITGENSWSADGTKEKSSHQLEHDAFFAALREGRIINNGRYMANSTLLAIMARQSAYTGRTLTWEQIKGSKQRLDPTRYAWDGEPPPAEVAIPGVTQFI